MKKLLLPLFLISFAVFSQKKIDTIYVSSVATTYLIFDDAITLVNLGNTDYQAQPASTNQSGIATQVLFLKAKSTHAKPTTLLFQQAIYFNEQEKVSPIGTIFELQPVPYSEKNPYGLQIQNFNYIEYQSNDTPTKQ